MGSDALNPSLVSVLPSLREISSLSLISIYVIHVSKNYMSELQRHLC